MKYTLRPSQDEIVDGVFENDAQLVIAGMGAGKTSATLHGLSELHDEDVIDCAIVLAPPLVASGVWPKEPDKWDSLRHEVVVRHASTPAQREAGLKWLAEEQHIELRILAISFHVIDWLKKNKHLIPAKCGMVFDESSFLKSPRSKNGRALRAIAGDFVVRYMLTGTPRPNGYEDMWGQYQALTDSKIWRPFDEWRRDNFKPKDPNGYRWEVHDFRAKKIDKKVAPLTTVVHADLDLPAMNVGADFDVEVQLSAKEFAAYEKMEDELAVQVAANVRKKAEAAGETVDVEALTVVAMSQAIASAKLSQIAQGYLYDEGEAVSMIHSRKVEALEMLRDGAPDENLLVWYGFRADLDLIRDALHVKDLPTLGGDTSSAKKARYITQFGEGRLPNLAAHPASAAHGIDELKLACRRMVWFCPTWSAEQYDQALKRLHRPGQTRPVFSHRIVAKDTVDEVKVARVEGKMEDQAVWQRMIEKTRKELGIWRT